MDTNKAHLLATWSALKPCSGTLLEPVTNWSSLARISSLYDSTIDQNQTTCKPRVRATTPAHLLGVQGAVLEPGVGPPVVEVDGPQPADHQLQLPLVERLQQALRDQLVEALLQSQELLLDPMHEPGGFSEM